MNCRKVEGTVFPDPAVAGILREHYVEARLHTDDYSAPERTERQRELQQQMTGVKTLPVYLIQDPDSGEILDRRDGYHPAPVFVEFLRRER